jgi:class 3 adenylate cyclase
MISCVAACPRCGAQIAEQAKFCSECGAALGSTASRERRVVSVLFADLQGFTGRSERLDVEDVDAFLAPYRERLRREVERTGGIVSDFAGDGMMALFGAPVAHEDDPERAVRAAIAIRDWFLEPGSAPRKAELHVRLGVTTGEVLVTLGSDGAVRATGDVVNTAARLEAAAPADGALVDEVTYRATNRAIDLAQAEPIQAKGKSVPVAAWLVGDARSLVPEQARVGGLALVGREVEVGLVRSVFDRSRLEPSAQLVSVIGEPGIGKTRMIEELNDLVEEMGELITWRVGRSLSYGEGVAFWARGEMVKSQAGIFESDSAGTAETKLDAAVDAVVVDERDRGWVKRHLRPLIGLEAAAAMGKDGRVEAFAAWRRFFEAIAEDGPTVLVFEDLHWADDALLDFIDLLADRAGAVPLLMVCTARPELLERREHWGGGKLNSTTIALSALSSEDTARLIGDLLDQALLPADVQRALLDRAGGNPLYAQEYLRMLQDRGLLIAGAGGWALTGEVDGLPESIQGIIAARLDTLTADEKRLIQDASVIGRTAWLGACRALTDRSSWEADELLHALERRRLVHRIRRSSIVGEVEFVFDHALTRDVAYSQIRREDRAEKHEAAAAWIERLAGERDDKAQLLADHYHHALSLRQALGDHTTTLAPRARDAYTTAARQAAATYAHASAAHFYRAALDLTDEDDVKLRAGLILGLARARHSLDSGDEALLRDTIDAQLAAQDWEGAATAESLLGDWHSDHTSGADADAAFARAAQHAARNPPSETMCKIAVGQAGRLAVAGRHAEALELTTRTLQTAEAAGLGIGTAILHLRMGQWRAHLGDAGGAADMTQAARALADAGNSDAAIAYFNLADVVRGLGDMTGADAGYANAEALADRFGLKIYLDMVTVEQAYQAYHRADLDAAWRVLDGVVAGDNRFTADFVGTVRGRLQLVAGDWSAALSLGLAGIRYATEAEDLDSLYYALALVARSHSAAGRDGDARAACERFITTWATGGLGSRGIELCEVAHVLAAARRHEEIREASARLPEAARWRDALVLLADERYAEAAALYEEIGSRPLTADAHLLAAEQLSSQGRSADAQRHARAVLEFAEHSGAMLYARNAEQFLRASA